jgi:hypothetical protein
MSGAMNVSGVTQRSSKQIILTKSEEIIKLLYHEMVHYIGLEQFLQTSTKYDFALTNKNLNLAEAYAELMAIILYCAYLTIHFLGIQKINMYDF